MNNVDLSHTLKRHVDHLNTLFEEDPAQAIQTARDLLGSQDLPPSTRAALAGGILIDAGSHLRDLGAIVEGTALFQELHAQQATAATAYNFANGLHAGARLGKEPAWSSRPCHVRQQARALYSEAASDDDHRSRALTNLANLLRVSHRHLEAYDAYVAALEADPQNGVAASGVARLLHDLVSLGLGPKSLLTLAARYIAHAGANEESIKRYAGPHAAKSIDDFVQQVRSKPSRRRRRPQGYPGFVWEHRLALSYAMELFRPTEPFWDDLSLISVTEPIEKGNADVPPVFAMWNTLKADYAAARWIAFRATQDIDETVRCDDTLDYANYGTRQSLAIFAQRLAIDVLDKVACFASEYLELPGDARSVYFAARWHTKRKDETDDLEWQPAVEAELNAGNPGVLALGDLASDLTGKGYLRAHRLLRHSGTHRFIVLHELLPPTQRSTPFIEHHLQSQFEATTIRTLQICRAALTYAREMVLWRERRLRADGQDRVPMRVPTHHEIRGLTPRRRTS